MPNVVAMMGAVVISFTVVLTLAFRYRDAVGWMSDNTFGVVCGLSIVVLSVLLSLPWIPRELSLRSGHGPDPWPVGRSWKAPEPVELCPHLDAVAKAMRDKGIVLKPLPHRPGRPAMDAPCRINTVRFYPALAEAEAIPYRESYMPERSERDNPEAVLTCVACQRAGVPGHILRVRHPDECGAGTPWFPAAPEGSEVET